MKKPYQQLCTKCGSLMEYTREFGCIGDNPRTPEDVNNGQEVVTEYYKCSKCNNIEYVYEL